MDDMHLSGPSTGSGTCHSGKHAIFNVSNCYPNFQIKCLIAVLAYCHIVLNFFRSCRYNNLRNFVNMVAQPLALRKYV